MIYDKLDNIETYKGLSSDIYEGLVYLRQVTPEIANGVYQLNPRVKAIVSEYMTKEDNENGYEAHHQFIDIQFPIRGREKVSCLPIDVLQEIKPYNESIDAAFYLATGRPIDMVIGNGYFAIFYPQDGHMPQLCSGKQEVIKKITLKVEITK